MNIPYSEVSIGTIAKPHGYKGWIKLNLVAEDISALVIDEEWVFLMIQNKPVPFFLQESIELTDTKIAIKLKGVDSLEQAQELQGLDVHPLASQQSDKLIMAFDESQILSNQLLNSVISYQVVDVISKNNIGEIIDVQENVNQWILTVQKKEEEFLLPLHSDLFESIDHSNKKLYLIVPEGLLDL